MLAMLILLPVILAEPFWVTVELLRVDWKEGCLTTAGCSQPRFKVLEDMLPITERISISWPISEHFVQEASRPFVSHWENGNSEDVTLSCQVVGYDPTYGFPRVCDQTPSIGVFHDEVVKANLPEDAPASPSSVLSQLTMRGEEKLLHVSILVLAAIAVLASLSFACVLIIFLRQKRGCRHISVEPRYQPFSPSTCKTSKEESRYDMPWEQTPPFTHWLFSSSKSDAKTTSPLNSTSSMMAPYSFRSEYTIPQTNHYHHISPNSSIGQGHDSGLGFV